MSRTARKRAQATMWQSLQDFVAEGGKPLPSDDSRRESEAATDVDRPPAYVPESWASRTGTLSQPRGLDDDGRLMSAFSIDYDGRWYRYSGYRYDRLADAVAYAEVMQSRRSADAGPDPYTGTNVPAPSLGDENVMASLSISFRAGVYAYRGFRYDRLADAVNYARIDGANRA